MQNFQTVVLNWPIFLPKNKVMKKNNQFYFFCQMALILISVLPLVRINPEPPKERFKINVEESVQDNQTVAYSINEEFIRSNP